MTAGTGDRVRAAATLVGIASACHSGSTLLDLLLGNHSRMTSGGELNRLTLYSADRICTCGETVVACPYWSSVRAGLSKREGRSELIRWDDYHTDVPPQTPLARLTGASGAELLDGAPIAPALRARLAQAGIAIPEHSTLARNGVRDFKWQVTDPQGRTLYVLRNGGDRVDVYAAEIVRWKNPLRVIPEPLEVALALGSQPAVSAVRALSSRAAQYVDIARNTWTVADAMAEVTGASHVIDSSKSAVRLKLLYMQRPGSIRIVHLIRDGRAVAASAIRRLDISAATAARIWKRENQNLAIMLRTIPDHVKLSVRYEHLSENPVKELGRICDFLGLEYEEQLPTLWERPVHNIPGNPMLFNRSRRAIRKDDRWRGELSPADLRTVERAVGRLNRSLGYV